MDDYCDRDPESKKEEDYSYVALFGALGMGVIGVLVAMIMALAAIVFDL